MLLVFSVSRQKWNHFLTFLWAGLSKIYIQMSSGRSSMPYYEIATNCSWMLMPLCCSGWTLCNLKWTPATSCCGDYLRSWYDQLAFCLEQLMYHLQNQLRWLNWWLSSTVVHYYPSVTNVGILSKDTQIQKTSVCNLVVTDNVFWILWAFHVVGWIVGYRFVSSDEE